MCKKIISFKLTSRTASNELAFDDADIAKYRKEIVPWLDAACFIKKYRNICRFIEAIHEGYEECQKKSMPSQIRSALDAIGLTDKTEDYAYESTSWDTISPLIQEQLTFGAHPLETQLQLTSAVKPIISRYIVEDLLTQASTLNQYLILEDKTALKPYPEIDAIPTIWEITNRMDNVGNSIAAIVLQFAFNSCLTTNCKSERRTNDIISTVLKLLDKDLSKLATEKKAIVIYTLIEALAEKKTAKEINLHPDLIPAFYKYCDAESTPRAFIEGCINLTSLYTKTGKNYTLKRLFFKGKDYIEQQVGFLGNETVLACLKTAIEVSDTLEQANELASKALKYIFPIPSLNNFILKMKDPGKIISESLLDAYLNSVIHERLFILEIKGMRTEIIELLMQVFDITFSESLTKEQSAKTIERLESFCTIYGLKSSSLFLKEKESPQTIPSTRVKAKRFVPQKPKKKHKKTVAVKIETPLETPVYTNTREEERDHIREIKRKAREYVKANPLSKIDASTASVPDVESDGPTTAPFKLTKPLILSKPIFEIFDAIRQEKRIKNKDIQTLLNALPAKLKPLGILLSSRETKGSHTVYTFSRADGIPLGFHASGRGLGIFTMVHEKSNDLADCYMSKNLCTIFEIFDLTSETVTTK